MGIDDLILFPTLLTLIVSLFTNIIVEKVKPYLRRKKLEAPVIILNTISYYMFGLFIVVLSATVGPYVIDHLTSYTITDSYTMTASDATDYTLQALIAIVIGSYIAKMK
jgi:hypothetical protein